MDSTVDNPKGARPLLFLKDIKFEHSLFALPFAYLGLFLAEGGWPRGVIFFWVTVAMVSFRTFAMAVNRLIDRQIDLKNPRTRLRALPLKKLTPRFVQVAAFLSVLVFIISASRLGILCLILSPIPILLAWIYPYLKRFTWLSHGVLGIILGISPYGAWLASRGEFSWTPGLLLIGVASWVAGFDIFYSLQDYEFDREFGLQSIPVRVGEIRSLRIVGLLHGVALASWTAAGALAGLGWIYGAGLVLVALFLFREHWMVHRFGRMQIEQAFFTMNAAVSVVIFLATLVDLNFK